MRSYFWFCYSFLLFFSCNKETLDNKEIIKEPKNTTRIQFTKTFGGSLNDVAKAITKTADNGYAIVGYTQSNNGDITNKITEDFDVILKKYSASDVLEFTKIFGRSKDDRANSVIQTIDGGYAILGYSSNTSEKLKNNGGKDFWVVKTNAKGNVIWEKTFGFSGNEEGMAIIQTNDHGFLLVGSIDISASKGQGNAKTTSKKHAGGEYWAIKISNRGDFKWSNFFGGSFTDTPFDVVETQHNSFIIVGQSDSTDVDVSDNLGTYDFWVIHISAKGNLIWEKSFGGSQIDEAYGISKTSDNNFIILGNTRSTDQNISNNNGGADIWLIKIDINGNLIWEKSIGGSGFDVGRSIHKTANNGFLISGSSKSTNEKFTNKGTNDAWLLKVDNNGNLQWQKTIGGSKIDFLYDAIQINENSYVAVGETTSSDHDIITNKGFSDLLIVKITE